jgi:polyhydroxybutyrate depolymerase
MTGVIRDPLLENLHAVPLSFEGKARLAHVYVPQEPIESLPMVLVLHGAGGDSLKAAQQTRWCDYAEREKFIAVFPNGLPIDSSRKTSFLRNPQVWNSGVERGDFYSPDTNDVGYIDSLLNALIATYSINEQTIFAAGFSNGGGMTWRLALELSSRFAAVAPVCSYVSVLQPWFQVRPVSAIVINCLDDPFIPLNGGPVKDIWSRVEIIRPSVVNAVESYAAMLKCELESEENISDQVTLRTYSSKTEKSRVEFYTIANAGHVYPGGPHLLSERIAGKPTDAMNATEVIWRFFKRAALDVYNPPI